MSFHNLFWNCNTATLQQVQQFLYQSKSSDIPRFDRQYTKV